MWAKLRPRLFALALLLGVLGAAAAAPPKLLPSWAPGPARRALEELMETAQKLPAAARVAVFDVDGTLGCERPTYMELEVAYDELCAEVAEGDPLERAVCRLPSAAAVPESLVYPTMLGAFDGMEEEAYSAHVAQWMRTSCNEALGRRYADTVYLPMIELVAALRALDFTVAAVSTTGADFLRGATRAGLPVDPHEVIGSQVAYDAAALEADLRFVRGDSMAFTCSGPLKAEAIMRHLGRAPLLAVGNSDGDTEMLRFAASRGGLAMLLNHDDGEREFSYPFTNSSQVFVMAEEEGWPVVSMARDWRRVFAGEASCPVSE